jgi:hypothetical protein
VTKQQSDPARTTGTASRRLLWVGLALALVTIASGVTIWVLTPGRMERISGLIHEGMTYKQVDALCGPSPPLQIVDPNSVILSRSAWTIEWSGDDGCVSVDFIDDKVVAVHFRPAGNFWGVRGLRHRLRSWLGW